jgi:hypothetical protein
MFCIVLSNRRRLEFGVFETAFEAWVRAGNLIATKVAQEKDLDVERIFVSRRQKDRIGGWVHRNDRGLDLGRGDQ